MDNVGGGQQGFKYGCNPRTPPDCPGQTRGPPWRGRSCRIPTPQDDSSNTKYTVRTVHSRGPHRWHNSHPSGSDVTRRTVRT